MKKYINGEYVELFEEEVAQMWNKENVYYEDIVHSKIRERYTESQEFAILRQRDEKPDEFSQYYEYCEECKKSVKKSLQGSE